MSTKSNDSTVLPRRAKAGEPMALFREITSIPLGEIDPDRCVLWPFKVCVKGYGWFVLESRHTSIHRAVLEYFLGRSLGSLVTRHKCKSKNCYNPHHLESGTQKENALDRNRDGTMLRGEDVWASVLNAEKIYAIRKMRASGISTATVAGKFGVTPRTIQRICSGDTWKHLELGSDGLVPAHSNCKPCCIKGKRYPDATTAAKALGVSNSTITYWCGKRKVKGVLKKARPECYFIE